jgi:hypothetical protein
LERSVKTEIPSATQFEGLCRVFSAFLAGCGTEGSGVTLAKMLMTLSQSSYMQEEETKGGKTKEVYVKNNMVSSIIPYGKMKSFGKNCPIFSLF